MIDKAIKILFEGDYVKWSSRSVLCLLWIFFEDYWEPTVTALHILKFRMKPSETINYFENYLLKFWKRNGMISEATSQWTTINHKLF